MNLINKAILISTKNLKIEAKNIHILAMFLFKYLKITFFTDNQAKL